ncbi:dihydropteroate synthase [Pedobacter sp. MC2016-15]|uniref:dihydropteroate synthase n=1 Tax=Pedobacter sp. MC2016-15 TaxID=2994473 RepID=UPI002245CE2D|nr:dihydropteroate synthase [Pedobacter sp. MC2016-15]MCX2481364.1 dihydropteroate synthase [Pedobacter sp. MC2016-15]
MAKDTFLNRKITLNLKGELLDLSRPCVMGILNLTPDSFYTESRISSTDRALERVENCLQEGASFIDIGAYSSRPGAADVSTDEELKRMIPVVEAISKRFPEAKLSIDTFRAKVARESIEAGAHIINDISGGELDEQMFETVADLQVPYILMHMKGNPQNMQDDPVYGNVSLDVVDYFEKKVNILKKLGLKDIILDPGFGFAKTIDHNYELLNHMQNLDIFGLPVLVGFSRKSMIYKFLNISPQEALNATTVLNTLALQKGATILRVHDVKAAAECIALVEKVQER